MTQYTRPSGTEIYLHPILVKWVLYWPLPDIFLNLQHGFALNQSNITGIGLRFRVTFLDPIFISALGRPVVARAANGGMSEDEALAAALAASLGGSSESVSQSQASNQLSAAEQEDMQLAMALAIGVAEAFSRGGFFWFLVEISAAFWTDSLWD